MRGLGCLLGIALIGFGIVLSIMILASPNEGFIGELLTSNLCEEYETITSTRSITNGTNSTTSYYCADREGTVKKEITGQLIIIFFGVLMAPLLVGVGLIIVSAQSGSKQRTKVRAFDDNTFQVYTTSTTTRMTDEQAEMVQRVMDAFTGSGSNLTNRLQQLKDAYDKGLISQQEYEQTRRTILEAMDDNL
jgi:hypothetical protein